MPKQAEVKPSLLFVQFTLSTPSGFNGSEPDARNALTGLFAVDTTTLRGGEEISAVVGIRMRDMLNMLLEQQRQVTAEYNEKNPLPEEQPAEEQQECGGR